MTAGAITTHRQPPTTPEPHRPQPNPTTVTEIVVRVQRVGRGVHVLSPAQLPQHRAAARNPIDLARALQSCFNEVQIATYARKRGVQPDTAHLSGSCSFDDPVNHGGKPVVVPNLASAAPSGDKRGSGQPWATGGARERHPADYSPNSDGSWTSPSGRTVRDPERCRQIVRRRVAAGLSIVPDDQHFDLGAQSEQIAAACIKTGATPSEWLTRVIAEALNPAPMPAPAKLTVARGKRQRDQELANGQLELPLDFPDSPAVAA